MHKDKVSIIIPVYNAAKYLDACIQSVLRQTYDNWELLLVVDGATDNSEEICQHYADLDNRICVISQKNKGVSTARNTGISKATGEYLTFVDSDDELELTAIEVLVGDIIAYDADIASGAKKIIAANGHGSCKYDDGAIHIYEAEEMIKRSLLYDDHTRALHAKLFTRAFLGEIRFVDGHNINEDSYFLFQCYAKLPKVVQHNISAYKYFHRENSLSRGNFSDKYLDMLFFCDLKCKYISEKMPELTDYANDMAVRTNLLFLQVLCRTTDIKYKAVEKQCTQMVRRLYRYHHPINDHHKKLAAIVACGLYSAYKLAVRLKYYK